MRTTLAIFFAIFLTVAIAGCGHGIVNQRLFDADLWKSSIDDRAEMIDDLERNHIRKGMSEKEILALLGEPEERHTPDRYSDRRPNEKWLLRYELDLEDVPDAFDVAEFVVVISTDDEVLRHLLFVN
jgi:hypothetical protein